MKGREILLGTYREDNAGGINAIVGDVILGCKRPAGRSIEPSSYLDLIV
ncbi:hypothetical protein [Candidatus Nitronereus thalassa]|uniref:Uncharacterized protein n=1 Tax=Candidatus Nitronereus thalassa TaxID=3020898 RepID=A0ABU3K4E5_9BACT|nr:hypothetical protein [Candidatus Nitronereus thalassa]MDT7041295.1 hypothetical protein [Candidatus Nitronereus thalassa]